MSTFLLSYLSTFSAIWWFYVAQSFLLAGSIFGLDQYIRIINKHYHERESK